MLNLSGKGRCTTAAWHWTGLLKQLHAGLKPGFGSIRPFIPIFTSLIDYYIIVTCYDSNNVTLIPHYFIYYYVIIKCCYTCNYFIMLLHNYNNKFPLLHHCTNNFFH